MMLDLIRNINWINIFDFFWKIFPGLLIFGYAFFSFVQSLKAERENIRNVELPENNYQPVSVRGSNLHAVNEFINDVNAYYGHIGKSNLNSVQLGWLAFLGAYLHDYYLNNNKIIMNNGFMNSLEIPSAIESFLRIDGFYAQDKNTLSNSFFVPTHLDKYDSRS